jgi:hypothetical protein
VATWLADAIGPKVTVGLGGVILLAAMLVLTRRDLEVAS